MKVGDLVRENWGMERTGVVLVELPRPPSTRRRLFKVLWNMSSPALPTLVGPAWCNQLEIINESR